MKRLALETYNIPSSTITLWWRGPAIAVIPLAVLWFPFALFALSIVKWESAKSWDEYDAGWKDWHAKYDRYVTRDRKHKLNSVSLPSEWPDAHYNAVCTCKFEIIKAPDDASLFAAFQAHLDANEPEILDLALNA